MLNLTWPAHSCLHVVRHIIHWINGLVLILISLVVDDVEELELVNTLGGGDDAQPVTKLHLLKELLGPVNPAVSIPEDTTILGRRQKFLQVLEVAAGELIVGNDLDLAVTLLGDDDSVTQVTDTAVDLDALVQELLEGGDIENLVAGRLRGVDDELRAEQSALSFGRRKHCAGSTEGKGSGEIIAHLLRHLLGLALGADFLL